jgi:Squalene-hopene cyclase C-terminal domain
MSYTKEVTISVLSDSENVDSVLDLIELKKLLNLSFEGARSYLYSKFKLNPSPHINGGGWSQYLDEPDLPPSVTGTAHGILALRAMGENKRSPYILQSRTFILNSRKDDGGWSSLKFSNKYSLTKITSLVLSVLYDIGESNAHNATQDAIRWLLEAQKDDGGWGSISQDTRTDVTSTAYALRTLVGFRDWNQDIERSLSAGRKWLWRARNENSVWGDEPGQEGTLVHTAEAVISLIACGEMGSEFTMTRNWMIDRLTQLKNDGHFDEPYILKNPDDPKDIVKFEWAQTSREIALVSLLDLGVYVTDIRLQVSVRKILERQVNGCHWRGEHISPRREPIWATKQAVTSLGLYVKKMDDLSPLIALSAEVGKMRQELGEVQHGFKTLKSEIYILKTRERKRSLIYKLEKIRNFLWNPMPLLIGLILAVLAAYMFLLRKDFGTNISDSFVTILGLVGFSLTAYQIVVPHTKKKGGGEK